MRERRAEPRFHAGYTRRVPHYMLHEQLWAKVDSRGRLRLNVTEWAKEMGKDYDTARFLVDKLQQERRIRRVAKTKSGVGIYEVVDPETYDVDAPPPARPMRWG